MARIMGDCLLRWVTIDPRANGSSDLCFDLTLRSSNDGPNREHCAMLSPNESPCWFGWSKQAMENGSETPDFTEEKLKLDQLLLGAFKHLVVEEWKLDSATYEWRDDHCVVITLRGYQMIVGDSDVLLEYIAYLLDTWILEHMMQDTNTDESTRPSVAALQARVEEATKNIPREDMEEANIRYIALNRNPISAIKSLMFDDGWDLVCAIAVVMMVSNNDIDIATVLERLR